MDIKFEQCPFCGATERITLHSFPSGKFLSDEIFAHVECETCGSRTGNVHAETIEDANEQAMLLWNVRWTSRKGESECPIATTFHQIS